MLMASDVEKSERENRAENSGAPARVHRCPALQLPPAGELFNLARGGILGVDVRYEPTAPTQGDCPRWRASLRASLGVQRARSICVCLCSWHPSVRRHQYVRGSDMSSYGYNILNTLDGKLWLDWIMMIDLLSLRPISVLITAYMCTTESPT